MISPYSNVIQQALANANATRAAAAAATPSKRYYDLNDWSIPEMSAADAAYINRAYDPNRGNVRFDETVYGSGANAIRTYADAARTYATYQALQPHQKGYENAQNYNKALLHNTGISDWRQASPRQLFEAIDNTFQGYQEDNKKENFGFDDIAGFIGPAVGFATGMPWLAAGVGALSSGIGSGFSPIPTLLGGLGGYTAGASGLFGSDGFLGPDAGPISKFISSKFGGGGFVNPGGLGLSPSNLYNPASMGGPVANTTTSLAGGGFVNPGGLGVTANNLFGNAASGSWAGTTSLPGGGFTNPSALGGDPNVLNPRFGSVMDYASKGADALTKSSDLLSLFSKSTAPQAGTTAYANTPLDPALAEFFGATPGEPIPSSMASFFTPSATSGAGGDSMGRYSVYRSQLPQLMAA